MTAASPAAQAGAERPAARYVFIVGLSRSGTTLMRRILNTAPDVAICPENHYLGHLLPRQGVRHRLRRLGDLRDDRTVDRVVDYLYERLPRESGMRRTSRLWTWLVRAVPRDELGNRLAAADRSEAAVLQTVMDIYAEHRGARVGGEKTPSHLRYVGTLLEWFPGGRVIHMVRDPRAVFVSEVRRRRKSPGALPYRALTRVPGLLELALLLQTTASWIEGVVRAGRYRRRYPGSYRIVRFEDLVREPERVLPGVCSFLGIDYDPALLRQTVVSDGAMAGQAGFDAAAADRWRGSIPQWAKIWLEVTLGRSLRAFGYLGRSR